MKFVALGGLAAAAFTWFGWNLDWAEVSASIRRADWRMVAVAVVLVWLTYLVRAFRWRVLLAPHAPKASLREAFAATTVGFSAIFLVGRAVGEVLRPAFLALRDPEVKTGPAFVTIAVERVFDMSAVILLFAANLVVLRLPGADEALGARIRDAGLLMLVGAAGMVVLLAYVRRHADAATSWLESKLVKAPSLVNKVGRVLAGLVVHTSRTLDVLAGGRALLLTIGWTAALWAAITGANLLVLRAFGLTVGVSETIFVLGWSLVGSLVPTPGGGAGTYHLATAYGLILVLGGGEQTANAAKAAVIVLNLVVFGAALFFGLYYFLRSGIGTDRFRELFEAEKKGDLDEADEAPRVASVRGA